MSTLGNRVPSILGTPWDVLGLTLLAELAGREGREGALFNSSLLISKILKLFLLAVLFALFFDDIETLSLSSRCPRVGSMASESDTPLREGREGALFKSSMVISKILKLFRLAVLFVLFALFFDDIETLSLSSRCLRLCDMASESLPPLS